MSLKNRIRILAGTFFILAVGFWWVATNVFPAISGYGSKNLCSAVYLQYRDPAEVLEQDLADFPVSLGTFSWNPHDSSTQGTVWGLAGRKTIYRKNCGCTVVNGLSEEDIRKQSFNLPERPAFSTDTIPWPAGDKILLPLHGIFDRQMLDKAIGNAMIARTFDGDPAKTRAFLVLYDGQIVGEQYAPGFDSQAVMLGWSISKSITGALTGILVKDAKLSLDDPAPVPEWKNSEKRSITIRDLLQQVSGLDFTENYGQPSSVTRMLFSEGDMAGFTAGLPLKYRPGTHFNYSSGNSNILSRVIREAVGEEAYPGFPYERLFHRINAYSFLLEPDATGTYVGSSYSYATARDFARFGLLYYNHGAWHGEQILPADWVEFSTRPPAADNRQHYGFQFWLNGLDEAGNRWFPDVPPDMYFADGYGGQNIYIIPSRKLIVVRLGLHKTDANKFLKEVLEAFSGRG